MDIGGVKGDKGKGKGDRKEGKERTNGTTKARITGATI